MNKINILVVDDRPEGLMAVEAVLSNPQYNIVTASSGTEALKHLLREDYAVILLDVQMPIMNGFETAAVIKTREKSKDIPIVFMSAINQDEHYVYQGYGVGAVDYLLKPFDPYILKSKVAIFADLYRMTNKLKEQAQKLHENDIKIYSQALDRLELESLRKYQYLADALPQIVFRFMPDGSYAYCNKVWFEFTGLTESESQYHGWRDAIHPLDLALFMELFSDSSKAGQEIECRIKNRAGVFRWHLIKMDPEIYSEPMQVKTWLGTATDIEERKTYEQNQRFLAEAGELLVSSLDFKSNIEGLGQLAVPQIADWITFDIMNGDEELTTLASYHENSETLLKLQQKHSAELEHVHPVYRPGIIEKDETALAVALFAHGKPIGVMRLEFHESGRKYDEATLKLAQELGSRVSMSYENSRLYRLSQEAIEIRNDFLSIASHELNTPITSLKLQLQMVLKGLQNSKDGQFPIERFHTSVTSSIKQVNRLIQLIQVLLDVSRIQSGKFTFTFGKVSVEDVVREVIERHHEIISNGDCDLVCNKLPLVSVNWDKTRIEQVITNLLTNAIKYAPGKIEVSVKEGASFVTIEVIDHGDGIRSDKLGSIFNRFERASSLETVGGLGLGLFIVKQIVEGHHGTIDVQSVVGKGTSFIVSLPYDAEVLSLQESALKAEEHRLN